MRMKLRNETGTFEIDVENRDGELSLRREDGLSKFLVNERPPAGFNINIDGEITRGYALRRKDSIYIHLRGKTWTFTDVTHEENTGDAGGGGLSERQVSAPMPGNVIKVMVAEGDKVAAKQPLVIVEAMKMENEVCASAEAVVGKVLVEAGQQVGFGEVMIELIPPESEDEA